MYDSRIRVHVLKLTQLSCKLYIYMCLFHIITTNIIYMKIQYVSILLNGHRCQMSSRNYEGVVEEHFWTLLSETQAWASYNGTWASMGKHGHLIMIHGQAWASYYDT